jgi:hypothetical protein
MLITPPAAAIPEVENPWRPTFSLFQRHSFVSFPQFADVVPQADDRSVAAVVLEAQHVHSGGTAVERPSGDWWESV